ncbi:hypothetical protein N4G37_13745, partial [Enterococcus faecalis]|uniref:hypothetical protein n=1 Tax=Enterococcus faecalis TaxID=1351 RepID=UPI0021B12980
VDDPLDPSHPEFAGSAIRTLRPLPLRGSHGIATAALAGAPKNDVGITGVWPGMRVLNAPVSSADFACSDRIDALVDAIKAKPSAIVLEYG